MIAIFFFFLRLNSMKASSHTGAELLSWQRHVEEQTQIFQGFFSLSFFFVDASGQVKCFCKHVSLMCEKIKAVRRPAVV